MSVSLHSLKMDHVLGPFISSLLWQLYLRNAFKVKKTKTKYISIKLMNLKQKNSVGVLLTIKGYSMIVSSTFTDAESQRLKSAAVSVRMNRFINFSCAFMVF